MNRTVAIVLDMVLVVAFAALGRASHAEALDVAGLSRTALPFLAGALLAWITLIMRRGDGTTLSSGVFVWATPESIQHLTADAKPGLPKGIEVQILDHAFTDLTFDDAGTVALRLVGPGGRGVGLRWDSGAPWVQLCIPDENNPTMTRQALAVEPMTCPPDAFNSGVDLVILPPGGEHTFRLTIGPIDPALTTASSTS